MKPFTYVEPTDLAGVIAALGADARPIAGGSDLLGELKEGTAACDRLVSLAGVEALRGIERMPDGGLRIGALTTLAALEHSDLLVGPYAMLREAARGVATPEVRNQGTLGGNLCQRPRCLHYRSALVPCLKKGGAGCPAVETPYQSYLSVMGAGGGCYAIQASDLAPPLIALDAVATLAGPAGARELPLADFFAAEDPTRENRLAPGELLTGVRLPALPPDWRGHYSKGRERTAGDFPIVSVAVGYALRSGRIEGGRVVLGGVAPTPLRSRDAEAGLEGALPSNATAVAAASAALAAAQPLAHNTYKVEMARALVERAVLGLAAAAT